MSGIEIAGLLLGAFPLLISAMEHYRKSAEVLENWWQYKREYRKSMNDIQFQEMAFKSNVESFLLPLIVDENEAAALIADPGGMKWKDPALEDKMKSRFPKSYDLFLDTIYDIKYTVDDLKDDLGVSRDKIEDCNIEPKHKPKRKSTSNPMEKLLRSNHDTEQTSDYRRRKWRQLKFGFNGAHRANCLEEIAHYNARLKELLDIDDLSEKLKQSRQYIKSSAVKRVLWKCWRHAASLHQLLGQAWCCQCKSLHRACLLLHHETNVERTEFSICFLYAASRVNDPCPWSWKEMHAQHIDHTASSRDTTLAVPQSLESAGPVTKSSLKASKRNDNLITLPSRPKVSWTDPPSSVADSMHQTAKPTVITDLCSVIATSNPAEDMFGLLKGDEDSYILRRGEKTKPLGEAYQTVSLERLLNKDSDFRLNRRQRYKIAYTIASSHLQLYPSPWLHPHWSKKDIIFNLDPQDTNSIQLEQPFILHAFFAQTPTSPSASRDRSLPTLGILLIELCFGSALEDQEMKRQCHSEGGPQSETPEYAAAMDLAVALEWSESVAGEAGETYADAVNWCLRGRFAGTKNDKWREELFANVVRPLQSYHELHSMTREEWLKSGPVV